MLTAHGSSMALTPGGRSCRVTREDETVGEEKFCWMSPLSESADSSITSEFSEIPGRGRQMVSQILTPDKDRTNLEGGQKITAWKVTQFEAQTS